jgi:glutamine amidotransferase
MFMHNGHISNFSSIKLRLAQHVRQRYFINVQGGTDSEWAFALFLDCLEKLGYDPASKHANFPSDSLRQALLQTLKYIKDWTNEAVQDSMTNSSEPTLFSEPSLLNIAVTDGNSVVVSRYVTSKTDEAASLYYSSGTRFFEYSPGQYRMERKNKGQDIVMIASEPLTFERNDWIAIPTNTVITIKRQTVLLHPILDEYYDKEPGQPRSSHFAESKGLVSPMVVGQTETGVPPLEREGRRREVHGSVS